LPAECWPTVPAGASWVRRLRDDIVLDIVDPPALAGKAARSLLDHVGLSFAGVCVRDASGLFAMHGVAGGFEEEHLRKIRVSPGQGLGGKVVALRRPVTVNDYVRDPAITPHFRDFAVREELAGMAAVPVVARGDVVAILYGATRGLGTVDARAAAELNAAAAGLAELFDVAVRHQDDARQHAAAERQRIAAELHDTVGPLLFALGASARRLGEILPNDLEDDGIDARAIAGLIGTQAAHASVELREALRRLGPRTPEETVPVAVRIDLEEFTRSTGVPGHVVIMGEPRDLGDAEAAAMLGVVREALFNAAKHARAGRVLVTLRYTPDAVQVIVQDDGRGLPPGFALRSVSAGERGLGLPSLLRRLQQQGGTLEVRNGDPTGTVVRATLRTQPANSASTRPHNAASSSDVSSR
jgi:signal transduction histidine kinase